MSNIGQESLVTIQIPTDVEAFHPFLTRQLTGGAREKSPEELLQIWRSECADAVADIREAVREMDAGKIRPLREVDAELREKYKIPRGE